MAFSLLPLEVNAHIAGYLDDASIAHFAGICPETFAAVKHDRSPLWRTKFIEHYDLPPATNNAELKKIYQLRRHTFRSSVSFKKGTSQPEKVFLFVLKHMILDSFASGRVDYDTAGRPISRNIQAIRDFIFSSYDYRGRSNNLLANVRRPGWVPGQNIDLIMMQIMLSDLRFTKDLSGSNALGFVDAQKAMYATKDAQPLFTGPGLCNINLPWVLNAIEFFKHHLNTREDPELSQEYDDLAETERVHSWRRPLTAGSQCLGKHWKGAYTYLDHHEVRYIRTLRDDNEHQLFIDKYNDDGQGGFPFQTLCLDFSAATDPQVKAHWPNMFEKHLQSLSHPSIQYMAAEHARNTSKPPQSGSATKRRTRAQNRQYAAPSSTPAVASTPPHSLGFQGAGIDDEKFYAAGWLNPVPPQLDIPGFQRFTMMKFFVDQEDSENEDEEEGVDKDTHMTTDAANYHDDAFSMPPPRRYSQDAYADVDVAGLWAYEGVVLPGGEIIVGRWWSPKEGHANGAGDIYSGPFMLWCCDA